MNRIKLHFEKTWRLHILLALITLSLLIYLAYHYNRDQAYQLGYEHGYQDGYYHGCQDTKDTISTRIFTYLGEGDMGLEWQAYCIKGDTLPDEWYADAWEDLTHQ